MNILYEVVTLKFFYDYDNITPRTCYKYNALNADVVNQTNQVFFDGATPLHHAVNIGSLSMIVQLGIGCYSFLKVHSKNENSYFSASAQTKRMQPILVSCVAPFRSNLQKNTGPVRVMTFTGPV